MKHYWTVGQYGLRDLSSPLLSSPQFNTKFPIFESDVGQNICLHFKLQTAPQIDLIINFRQKVSQSRIVVLVTIEKLCYYYLLVGCALADLVARVLNVLQN